MSAPSQVYLLAAGRGSRAGGPKAWLESGGRPLLRRQIEFLLGFFDPERVAVSIQADWLARCRNLCATVNWIAVDPDAQPLASLQTLIKAMPMVRWSFVYHVDQPLWKPALFDALLREAAAAADEAFVPTHEGRRGHPVLLSHGLKPALLELDPGRDRLDVFLRGRRSREIPVPFSCVLDNWNDGAPAQ